MSSADDEGRLDAEAEEVGADPVDQTPAPDETAPAADAAPSDTEGTGVDAEIAQQEPAPVATTESAVAEEAPAADAAPDDTAATPDQPVGEADDPAPDPDEVPTAEPEPPAHDDDRTPLVELLRAELGDDAVLGESIGPGRDIVVRVPVERWADAALALRDKAGMTYFCFLNAIDWLPSPFGKNEGDPEPPPPPASSKDLAHGVAGGETRFQVFARLERPGTGIGITLKADVDDENPTAPTWTAVFSGADWHERETHEMYGIHFEGHGALLNLYLPGGFEGYPGRKDYPLLSRMVKPWPGLVDVEPMPGEPDEDEATEEAPA